MQLTGLKSNNCKTSFQSMADTPLVDFRVHQTWHVFVCLYAFNRDANLPLNGRNLFLSLSPFWASVMAPLGHWTSSTHTGLPQNVVPLFFWLPIGIPALKNILHGNPPKHHRTMVRIVTWCHHNYLINLFLIWENIEAESGQRQLLRNL